MRKWTTILTGLVLLCLTVGSIVFCTRRAVPPTVGVDSPAVATLSVMLGGSRGILAEILWWRISDLQYEHRYVELLPLTELLVTLEPTSEDAWIYNAWNLAYNISVAHTAPEERWEWVKRGLSLLDRALRIQPTSQALLQQMGWMWEDKIGGSLDPASRYYQTHTNDIALPADVTQFETCVGAHLDWTHPFVRALYWYAKVDDPSHRLRILVRLLNETRDTRLIPYFVATVRPAYPTLTDAQQQALRQFTLGLATAHPNIPELNQFLQELL